MMSMMVCMCILLLMTLAWAGAGRGVVAVTEPHNLHPMVGRAGYWDQVLGEPGPLLGTGRACGTCY